MKLSKTQQEVLNHLARGSKLVKWLGYNSSASLQKNISWQKVSLATLNALYSKGLIYEESRVWPRSIWKLTNK